MHLWEMFIFEKERANDCHFQVIYRLFLNQILRCHARLLTKLFLSIGGSLGTKVRAYFEEKGARKISFNFADATRDSVRPELLRSELGRYHVKEDSNLSAEEGRRYYIV